MNENTIRFTKSAMSNLIKSVSVTIGGIVVSTHKSCSKCGDPFECYSEDMEYNMIRRMFDNKKGDMTRCWDCDENVDDEIKEIQRDVIKKWRMFVERKKKLREWKEKMYDVCEELKALPPGIVRTFPGGIDYHISHDEYMKLKDIL